MSDEQISGPDEGKEKSGDGDSPVTQQIAHSSLSARVPERVARGVFSTGVVVLTGNYEFILDFLLRMTRPHQLAARVILPIAVVPRLIAAMRENLDNYTKQFGPPRAPKLLTAEEPSKEQAEAKEAGPADQPRFSPEEIYEQLKLNDEILAGTYANAVMIGHTPTEFAFDFITTFFPRSTVSCRVFLSAPNVPRFLDSLSQSYQQFQQKLADQQKRGPGNSGP